ncbi:MAG: GAF domain-containing protein [Anaerolineae bacterium]|nr:GAF domain-containing protein [Anaerolineae bacterium]
MSNFIPPSATQPTETARPVEAMPRPKRWSIHFSMRFKLIIAFLVVALIPLGAMVYINYLSTKTMLIGVANRSLSVGAEKVIADIETFFETNKQTVQEVATWPEVISYLSRPVTADLSPDEAEKQRIRESLQRLRGQDENAPSFALLNRQGQNVVDTSGQIDLDESNQNYFIEPSRTGQLYVSPVIFEPAKEEAFLYISSPVINTLGQIVGVVRMQYKAEVLQQLIAQHNGLAGEQSFAILLDDKRIQLANGGNPDQRFTSVVLLSETAIKELQTEQRLPNKLTTDLFVSMPGFQAGLDNPTAPYFTIQLDETDDQLALAAIEKLQVQQFSWNVVFVQPQEAFLSPLQEQIFTAGVILLAIIIVVFILAFNISRPLSNPLVFLADVAQKVAGGALGLQAPEGSRDEIGVVARAVNSLANQLRDLSGNLDQYIAERTRALGTLVRSLETSTQIGRQITTILEIDELLRYVVNRIQIEFNFYYTHIYLVDQATGDLVMAEGSGEVGRRLKAQGHRLKAGEGIVGTVASSNEFFLSNDVSKVLNFVSNPLLPDTRSELALPLRKGDRVVGVLDIQDNKLNRFTSADVSLMQSIANQTAVAIDNARLLTETQNALKEVQRLTRRLTREGWDQISEEISVSGYRFSSGAIVPISPDTDVWLPPMKEAVTKQQLIKQTESDNGGNSETELAVPLILRGEVIGVLSVKREEITAWADEEVAAIEAVANQVPLALENARLSKEQEKTIVQLKEVDRLKSEFLTSMSHELRTPLNSIIGFADVILQGIDGEVSDMALNDVRLIYNSGQHLLTLINDILDLSKIEAGEMELVREPLDIEEMVSEVMNSASVLKKNKPVEIITNIEEDLPAIYADKLRINQILLNLVSNAVKFTDKGIVTIKAEISSNNPSQALISVMDQGIGIPKNMLHTVFDRFRQVDASRKRKAEGSGLGLAICKQLVEMHGGMIEVTSVEGKGSNFYFTIPFVDAVVSDYEPIGVAAGN